MTTETVEVTEGRETVQKSEVAEVEWIEQRGQARGWIKMEKSGKHQATV